MSNLDDRYYISMLSDYGFKRAFGNPNNTLFLRTALKALLGFKQHIVEVTFGAQERSGMTKAGRGGAVDITCTDESGNIYIVEMQRLDVAYFIHRVKFYTLREYDTLVKKGEFNFKTIEQTKIYTVSFLEKTAYPTEGVRQVVNLRNEKGHLIDDQITHIIIQLAKFNTPFEELKTDLDKLLYIMKYTETATKANIKKGKKTPEEKWIEDMIRELEMSNLSPRERADAEKAFAREAFALQYILEKDREVKEKDKALLVKDKALLGKDRVIEKKDKTIEKKDKTIEKNNKTIEKNNKTIEKTVQLLLNAKVFTDEHILEETGITKTKLKEIRQKIDSSNSK